MISAAAAAAAAAVCVQGENKQPAALIWSDPRPVQLLLELSTQPSQRLRSGHQVASPLQAIEREDFLLPSDDCRFFGFLLPEGNVKKY